MSRDGAERAFYNLVRWHLNTIMEVGAGSDSPFVDFHGVVHYFDPSADNLAELKRKVDLSQRSSASHYTAFGLGADEKGASALRRGADYMDEKKMESADLLVVRADGLELDVLMGFGEHLRKVGIVQFEYGVAYIDRRIHLRDVINYLQIRGFRKFAYLDPAGLKPLTKENYAADDYRSCNIVCFNCTRPEQ